jgi:chromosomal replication initiator protein
VDVAVDATPGRESEQQVNDAEPLWNEVGHILKGQVSEAVWLSTFQDARALQLTETTLTLSVPSTQARERIEGPYLPLVKGALDESSHPELILAVVVRPERGAHDTLFDDRSNGVGPPITASAVPGEAPGPPRAAGGLNSKYTFETFVKGASNQFALAAALRVAETPARSYNPLFIYGAAGLGKTHLLHAIGHYVDQNYAHHTVRYVSTEHFLNEYVDAIRQNTTGLFKRRYRDVDVLLIDDIQFMEGKEGLQEEFFHTFNSLHGANKQIVISSDRTPDAIQTLEDRLRGRFKWGLITDIQPPDLETRLAILRNKAERDHSRVPAEVLEFIATRVTTNIRELEGALIRVSAYASLNQVPVTIEMAERLLVDLLKDSEEKPLTPDRMLDITADYFGFTVEALKGKSRQRPLVTARQIGMYVMREQTELSYPAIAREFGGRDHTTVIHAVEKITKLIAERQQVYDQVIELTKRFKAGGS